MIELFREVGIPAPEARVKAYAHQLSGGLAQRVMIAAALAGNPRLLIADEPTTALDVTIQLQVLRLLAAQRERRRLSTLLITHDLAVVAALADRILVLYAGRVVEEGARDDILKRPQHPYTQALVRASLLRAEPDGRLFALSGALDREALTSPGCRFRSRCGTADALDLHHQCSAHEPALAEHGPPGHRVRCCAPGTASAALPAPADQAVRPAPQFVAIATLRAVSKHYRLGPFTVRSVEGVDLVIRQGEALGLVGESGCGKSTLARLLLNMQTATSGDIHVVGQDVSRIGPAERRQLHRDAQLVFQDPAGAFDPRMRLGESLLAPLTHNRISASAGRRASVLAAMRDVGLDDGFYHRLPRECSGGQLQRAVIARALLMSPRLLICDEPTSALDASIRAQILNLLGALRTTRDLTLLMITHDLRVVRHLCDRVAVMYMGEIVEMAETSALFAHPAHPYTQALITASMLEEHGLEGAGFPVRGEPPSPLALPSGCRFRTRCGFADERCAAEHPPLAEIAEGRAVRCWHWSAAMAETAQPAPFV